MTRKPEGARVCLVASGQLGHTEYPAGSNRTPYGEWYQLNGVAWCSIFVAWCHAWAYGIDVRKLVSPYYAGCVAALNGFVHNGWTVPVNQAQSGDVVFYHFPAGHPGANHTGIIESVSRNWLRQVVSIVALEGNTSAGNDANGGQVQRRVRPRKLIVGVGRLPEKFTPGDGVLAPGEQSAADDHPWPIQGFPPAGAPPAPQPQADVAGGHVLAAMAFGLALAKTKVLREGDNDVSVKFVQVGLQKRLGAWLAVDGSFGASTAAFVKALQAEHGLTPDGVVGPKTWAVLWPV